MKDLIYDVWLSTLPGISAGRKLALMQRFGGAAAVFRASKEELTSWLAVNKIPSTENGAISRMLQKDLRRAEWCMKQAKKTGAAAISLQSSDYPAQLKTIPDPPIVLFALGDISLLKTRCVAVVGTRRASPSRSTTQRAAKPFSRSTRASARSAG